MSPNSGPIYSAAFSPDGTILATGDYYGKIFLWDMTTHRAIGEPLAGQRDGVLGLAFSPDGKTLASVGCVRTGVGRGCREGTYLWDVDRRLIIGQMETGYTGKVLFSPDGRYLATIGCQENDCLDLWDLTTSKRVTGDSLDGDVVALDISPDGKLLAWIDYYNEPLHEYYTVSVWNTSTQQLVGEPLRNLAEEGSVVRFEPDGRSLLIAGPHGFIVWNIDKKKIIDQMSMISRSAIEAIALSPNTGILAFAMQDSSIVLWDTKLHKRFANPIRGMEHSVIVTALAFSPDGNVLASANGSSVNLWGVKYYPVSDAPPGLIAFTSIRDGKENIYTMYGDGTDPHIFTSNGANYSYPVWSPSGDYIAFCSDQDSSVGIYIQRIGEYYSSYSTSDKLLASAKGTGCSKPLWSPSGGSIAMNCGGTICLTDVFSVNPTSNIRTMGMNDNNYGSDPTWSSDGKSIAYTVIGAGGIAVVNADGSNRHLIITGGSSVAYAPQWSPDGHSIVYSLSSESGKSTEIWITNADGTNPRRLVPTTGVTELKWSPNGRSVAFVAHGEIYVVDSDGTNLQHFTQYYGVASSLSWSPDSGAIVFAAGAKIYALRIVDGQIFGGVDGYSPVWSPH